MFNTIKTYKTGFNQYFHFCEMECDWEGKPPPNVFIEAVRFTWVSLLFKKACLTCYIFGHKWSVDSQITANSASDTFECTRCGYSHEHIYY